MKQHFNPQSLANTVLMTRRHHSGAYLLVEGDTDCRFFSNFTDSNKCKIIPVDGKSNVISALKELEKRHAKGVLGIVDTDYWLIEGIAPDNNVLITDTHDVETMILLSPALEKVIKEFLPGDKVDIATKLAVELRQELIQVGLPLGYLRWLSFRENYEFSFDELPFKDFVDAATLVVDVNKILKVIRTITRKQVLPTDLEVKKKIGELEKCNEDPWHICQGHDLVKLIEIILPKLMGKHCGNQMAQDTRRKVHSDHLARGLRMAYEFAHFTKTQLYQSICAWEGDNPAFKVLGILNS